MFELLQPTHLLFVLVVALVVLGPKRLAETSRSLGRAVRSIQEQKEEFKEGLLGMADEDEPERERPDEKAAKKRERKV
jgi:sec-independent protein translocase protein TatB